LILGFVEGSVNLGTVVGPWSLVVTTKDQPQ
jgi:hypothetical protein